MSFDEYARNWDTEKRIDRAKIIAEEIVNYIDIDNDLSAMEYGCGTGLISFNLIDKFKDITLIDASKEMINITKEKIKLYNSKNIIAVNKDILEEEIVNKKYDVIYNSMVLHHIIDLEGISKEFYKLLNDNGYLCIVDLDKEDGSFHKEEKGFNGHNGFDQNELKAILEKVGFKNIESKTFYYDTKEARDKKIPYSLFILRARK